MRSIQRFQMSEGAGERTPGMTTFVSSLHPPHSLYMASVTRGLRGISTVMNTVSSFIANNNNNDDDEFDDDDWVIPWRSKCSSLIQLKMEFTGFRFRPSHIALSLHVASVYRANCFVALVPNSAFKTQF